MRDFNVKKLALGSSLPFLLDNMGMNKQFVGSISGRITFCLCIFPAIW